LLRLCCSKARSIFNLPRFMLHLMLQHKAQHRHFNWLKYKEKPRRAIRRG